MRVRPNQPFQKALADHFWRRAFLLAGQRVRLRCGKIQPSPRLLSAQPLSPRHRHRPAASQSWHLARPEKILSAELEQPEQLTNFP